MLMTYFHLEVSQFVRIYNVEKQIEMITFELLLTLILAIFEATGAVVERGSSLKPNHRN